MFLRPRCQLSGFETVSLSDLELTKLASNTQRSSSALGVMQSHHHTHRHTHHHAPLLTSVLSTKLRSSCLCGKHFTD